MALQQVNHWKISMHFDIEFGCLCNLQFLLDAAASRHLQLARDRHGCFVLQKCIEYSNDEQKNNLLNNITSAALRLSEDQYGYARSLLLYPYY
jgi:hypothetical protein